MSMRRKVLFLLILLFLLSHPQAFSQWEQTQAPAGTVNAMQANDEVVLACIGDVLYRSTDNGENWTVTGTGITQFPLLDIISLPGTSTFYACSEEYIYKSVDNGENWISLVVTRSFANLIYLYYHDEALFAAAGVGPYHGLHRTTDDGQTWQLLNNGLTSNGSQSMTHDEFYLYIGLVGTGPGSEPGVFRSMDNGDNWEFASTGLETDIDRMTALGSRIYACSYASVYYSSNHGASWNYTTGLLPGIPVISLIGTYNYIIACQLVGPFKLPGNGNTWEPWQQGLSTTNAFKLISDGEYSYCGTGDNGIWRRPVGQLVGLEEDFDTDWISRCITVYPNPTHGEIRILISSTGIPSGQKIHQLQILKSRIEIADLSGKVIKSQNLQTENKNQVPDISHVMPGTYFVRLMIEDQLIVKKIIKL